MEKIDIAVYIILAAIIGIAAYTIAGFIDGNKAAESSKEESQLLALNTISTGSTDSGDAAIDITPVKIDDKNLVLSISFNTHSVELSQFDLKQITILKYNGKTAYPTEAPVIEGHHSSGNIVFNIDSDLKDFEIIIKGIPKVNERMYKWKR